MAGGPSGVGGPGNVSFDAMQQLVGAGDMESALLAFGIERAQGMEKLVKAKIADMRERNASIQELQQAMQTIRAAKPTGDGEQTTAASPELAKAMDVLAKNGMALPSGITATNGSKIDQLENCLVELDKVAPKPDKAGPACSRCRATPPPIPARPGSPTRPAATSMPTASTITATWTSCPPAAARATTSWSGTEPGAT